MHYMQNSHRVNRLTLYSIQAHNASAMNSTTIFHEQLLSKTKKCIVQLELSVTQHCLLRTHSHGAAFTRGGPDGVQRLR
jgi:hypothetical protein